MGESGLTGALMVKVKVVFTVCLLASLTEMEIVGVPLVPTAGMPLIFPAVKASPFDKPLTLTV